MAGDGPGTILEAKSALQRKDDDMAKRVRRMLSKAASPRVDVTPATPTIQAQLGMGPVTEGGAPKELSRAELLADFGVPGIKHFWGRLSEDFLPELSGDAGRRAYGEMAKNSSTIAGILYAIRTLARQADWDVEPVDESEPEMERAEFLRQCMHDMETSWSSFLCETLSELVYGFHVAEPVFKVRRGRAPGTYRDANGIELAFPKSSHDDGKLGWAELAPRHQETIWRWMLTRSGKVEGVVQWAPPLYEFTTIPASKLLMFRVEESHGSPEGVSPLRYCYVSYTYLKRLQELEAIAVERDGCGVPKGYMPLEQFIAAAGTGPEAAAARSLMDNFKRILTGLKTDDQAGLLIPTAFDERGNKLYDVELMSSSGSRTIDIDKSIRRYMEQIAESVLAGIITLGHDASGSRALGDTKHALFTAATGAILDGIAGVMNSQAVPMLFEVNGEQGPYPKIVHGELTEVDLNSLGTYLTALAGVGVDLSDAGLHRYLLRAGGMPVETDVD